jgi:ABC-2 type transport system ATP-binding protein
VNGALGGVASAGAMRDTEILRVSGLTKLYGSRRALHDVGFAVRAGELVAVIGRNGAGKTTLLSILAGAVKASAGSVDRAPGEIGWVPQQPALYSKLSVAENLRLFARLAKVADVQASVAAMLAQTGLADRAGDRIERLSGGNRQRVNVALGLLSDPPVLLLDEPSSSLDPSQRERLWEFIAGLVSGGTSVLFSTHIVSEAERYAQRVLVLDEGELLFDGAPRELAERAGHGEQGDFEAAFVAYLRERDLHRAAAGERRPERGLDLDGSDREPRHEHGEDPA